MIKKYRQRHMWLINAFQQVQALQRTNCDPRRGNCFKIAWRKTFSVAPSALANMIMDLLILWSPAVVL